MTALHLLSPDFADDVDRLHGVRDRTAPSAAVAQSADNRAMLARIAAGDEQAFAEIFRTYTPTMYLVAAALLGSSDAAADVVQRVMLKFWEQRDGLQLRGSIGGYLRASTVNAARNALRGDQRARTAAQRAATTLLPNAHASPDTVDEDTSLDAQRIRVLEQAIDALPHRTREIFLLWWAGDLSYVEIAEAMGISVKGVEAARARALDALRQALITAGLGPGAT